MRAPGAFSRETLAPARGKVREDCAIPETLVFIPCCTAQQYRAFLNKIDP